MSVIILKTQFKHTTQLKTKMSLYINLICMNATVTGSKSVNGIMLRVATHIHFSYKNSKINNYKK